VRRWSFKERECQNNFLHTSHVKVCCSAWLCRWIERFLTYITFIQLLPSMSTQMQLQGP